MAEEDHDDVCAREDQWQQVWWPPDPRGQGGLAGVLEHKGLGSQHLDLLGTNKVQVDEVAALVYEGEGGWDLPPQP